MAQLALEVLDFRHVKLTGTRAKLLFDATPLSKIESTRVHRFRRRRGVSRMFYIESAMIPIEDWTPHTHLWCLGHKIPEKARPYYN
jgi:hypothetical protein